MSDLFDMLSGWIRTCTILKCYVFNGDLTMEYTKEENLLIQSYMNVSFITELTNLGFLKSDWYLNANFQDKYVHKHFPSIGIDNQGMILFFLYSLLVLPKELIQQKFPAEFEAVNTIVDKEKSFAQSTYNSDSNGIDYVRHIRNAVSHARVSFNSSQEVEFEDKYNNNECTIRIPLKDFGKVLSTLQVIYVKYIEQLQIKQKSSC